MKTTFLGLFFFLSLALSAQSKLVFEKLPPMPVGNASLSTAEGENDIYAIGGTTATQWVSSNLQIFDTKVNLWLQIPLKKLPRFTGGSALYLKEHECILLAGGIMPYGASIALVDSIGAIYPKVRKVRTLGATPEPARNLGLAHYENKVYLFGGSTGTWKNRLGMRYFSFSKKLYCYDLSNGNMMELPDMPRGMETDGGIIDGNLYLFGGFDGKSLRWVYKYNIEEKTWTKIKSLKRPLSEYALVQYGQYFIMVGDYSRNNQLMVYDTKTESTTYFKTNLQGRRYGASIIDDQLYVFGGIDGNLGSLRQQHYKLSVTSILGQVAKLQ